MPKFPVMKNLLCFLAFILLFSCEDKVARNPGPKPVSAKLAANDYWHYQDTSLTETVLYDKVFGMLVGSAIGDALGAPTEMWLRGQIEEEYGFVDSFDIVLREPSAEGPWGRNLPAGAGTDDTRWKELAIDYLLTQPNHVLSTNDFAEFVNEQYAIQLDDLKNTEGLEPEPYTAAIRRFEWLQEWARVTRAYESGDIDLYRDALNRFYGGEMACAGLLYASAIGAYFPGKPEEAYTAMHDLAIFDLGYARDISALGAALTALAFRDSLTNDSIRHHMITIDPEGYFDARLLSRLAYQQFQRAERIVRLTDQIDTTLVARLAAQELPPDFRGDTIEYVRLQEAYRLLDENAQDIPFHAGEIFLVSLTGMLYHRLDFSGAIEFIVNYGRDNDTSAALVGAILGAYHGAAALPAEQRELVVEVNREVLNIDLEELARELTEQILARRPSS
ncbi:ADP-ribosylglycohydrolase [Lewinellaceae bacterium SD302]|nr:ADP-ribosylglycohydrolase [Lewinellaceae bacterium SD302]